MKVIYAVILLWGSISSATTFQVDKPVISEDRMLLKLNETVLLDNVKDGYMSLLNLHYCPTGQFYLVIGCGFECNDNAGFIFKADGTGKKKITARWDYILQEKIEWSDDCQKLFYYRVNSTGANPPRKAPTRGWVQFDIKTGRKGPASSRRLKQNAFYSVFNSPGGLLVHDGAAGRSRSTWRLPADAKGIRITGKGRRTGRITWAPIIFGVQSGWVNQDYLFEDTPPIK